MSSLNGVLKPWQQQVEMDYDERSISPKWPSSGVPFCSREECACYDGKRCRLSGFQPSSICEPAVMSMAAMLEDQEQQVPYPLPENIEALVEAGRLQLAAQKKELLREAYREGAAMGRTGGDDFEQWFFEQFAQKQEPRAGQEAGS